MVNIVENRSATLVKLPKKLTQRKKRSRSSFPKRSLTRQLPLASMYLIGKPMARLVNTQGPMTFVRMNKETRSVLEIRQSKVEHWEE